MIRLLIFAIIFYLIGAKWPGLAQKIGIVSNQAHEVG